MAKKDMFNKKQSNMISLILGTLFLSTLFLSVAYAAMSTTLKITSDPIDVMPAEYYYSGGTFYNGNGNTTGTSTGKTKLSEMISIIPQTSNIYFKSQYLVSASEDIICNDKTINLIRHPSLTAGNSMFYVTQNVQYTLCSGTDSYDATGQVTLDGNKDKLTTKSERALVIIERGTLNLRGNIEFKNSETTLAYGSAIDNAGGRVDHRSSGKLWVHDNFSVGKGAICNRAYAGSSPTLVLYSTNTIENNTSTAGEGGGIYNEGLVDSQAGPTTIQNNRCEAGNGGGIYSSGASARINTTSTLTVSNNYAYNYGGGIYSSGNATNGITMGAGTLKVENNTADGGGGLCIMKSTADFAGTTLDIKGNKAYGGGGIYIYSMGSGPEVKIHSTNTTFSNNESLIENYAYGGGAILTLNTSLQIYGGTTTFSENSSKTRGGAIYCGSGSIGLGVVSSGSNWVASGTVTFQDNTAPEYSIGYLGSSSKCHLTTSIYNNILSGTYFGDSYTLH